MSWKTTAMAIGLAIAIGSPGFADDQKPPGWQFEIMPNFWLPGTAGTLQVKQRTARAELTVGDLLTLVGHGEAFAFDGYFGARYGRYSAFVDAFGGFLNIPGSQTIPTRRGTLVISGTAKVKPVILDVAFGYELGAWSLPERKRPLSLEAFIGTRYTYLGTDIEASAAFAGSGGIVELQGAGRRVSNNFNLVAPIGGVRLEVPLVDALGFNFRGDVGGSTRLTWELMGVLRYWLPWEPGIAQTWVDAGYRAVFLKQDLGDGNAVDLMFRGPMLGLGFAF